MNNRIVVSSLAILLSLEAGGGAQSAPAPAKHTAYYVNTQVLHIADLIPAPPSDNDPQTRTELAEVHRVEASRTPVQAAAAKADDEEEDIFVFRSVMGPSFTAAKLPLIAELSNHVKGDQSVLGGELKALFQRPRPYQSDKTLHPVCKLTDVHNSYPSGHSLSGYMLALTLAELAPEKRDAILARADEYAHNRVVCGVHYRADTEASRRIAYAAFGNMLANPKFQTDLAAAREELRIVSGNTH